jgi:hypothetical protein
VGALSETGVGKRMKNAKKRPKIAPIARAKVVFATRWPMRDASRT